MLKQEYIKSNSYFCIWVVGYAPNYRAPRPVCVFVCARVQVWMCMHKNHIVLFTVGLFAKGIVCYVL